MATLSSFLTGAQWLKRGPQTAAQRLYASYASTIASSNYSRGGKIPAFYAADAVFHNQNNADYHGKEIWPWIKALFDELGALKHDFTHIWEVQNDDGSVYLISHLTRHIWTPGNNSDKPTVSVPFMWVSLIKPSNSVDAVDGMQFQEVWIYWDTNLLRPFYPEDALVFRTHNTSAIKAKL
ncbi:hypothetical protein JDV02_000232 [Purpureocillium takamizusanense]|uniref:Uncharacterized protein n=1 Tax=Purpureocillium takamizusanense TaxID=2060973 RepID=A0A9Q8V599_9HYPO|nr:uncharacterized protein JDV02_000232 [Purpureocillium takamizusanense]UNI13490.1 hypothetical protein JDV02_000232 [Purpureocillium takamizusanense]